MNIVDLIKKEVDLKFIGDGKWRGFCPFHYDVGTPNFTVFEDTNTYYCFACKAFGTIFDWARQKGIFIDLGKLRVEEERWEDANSRIAIVLSDKLRSLRSDMEFEKWEWLMKTVFNLLRSELNEETRNRIFERIIHIRS